MPTPGTRRRWISRIAWIPALVTAAVAVSFFAAAADHAPSRLEAEFPPYGTLRWEVTFGDVVEAEQVLGWIDDAAVSAQISGTIRGLLLPGPVAAGLKIGDIDPRFDPAAIHQISDKALSIGGGVLEAVLVWLGTTPE